MNNRHRQSIPGLTAVLAGTIAASAALAAGAAGAGQALDWGPRFASAQDRYERGHYPAAFVEFAALADDGHCEAARIARQMARHGDALYGVSFAVAPARLERWRQPSGCPAAATAAR